MTTTESRSTFVIVPSWSDPHYPWMLIRRMKDAVGQTQEYTVGNFRWKWMARRFARHVQRPEEIVS